jgi:NAD(P) transhydrogenase
MSAATADYDFLVIGSGPSGQKAAIQAAKLGKRTLLIERQAHIGGVSVHSGTIPSKTLREAILYLTGWRQRGFYGRDYRLKKAVTAADLMQRLEVTVRHEIEVMHEQVARNGITVVHGVASFASPHHVSVKSEDEGITEFAAEKILIAVGTRPRRPPEIPFDDVTIIDSDGILRLKKVPRRMIVVGGGVIGLEYASMFKALDVEVTLVHEQPGLLGFIDHEIMDEFVHHLHDQGMVLRLGEKVSVVEKTDDGRARVILASGKRLVADLLLFTAGRTGCVEELNLERAGLAADARGQIKVDAHYCTEVPHIYAAGDVIGFPSLASTSMEQGRLAARHAFGLSTQGGPVNFPYGIYSVPEISTIGMTEQELREKKIPYEIGVARFRETARGQILGLREGLLKMLVGLEDRRLLGVHIVGESATELIHIGQAVIQLNGTVDYFVDNVFNYPTLAEAYKIAALDCWNRLQN